MWFVDLIGSSQSVKEGVSQLVYLITCKVFFKVPALFQMVSSGTFALSGYKKNNNKKTHQIWEA